MDYISDPISVTFIAETNATTIYIPVIKDNIAEESETFSLKLIIPSSLDDIVTLGNVNTTTATATATITDDTSKNY